MNDFIDFIVNNWKWLILIAVSVITFILQFIFKKSTKVIDNSAVASCARLIQEAEGLFGAGNGDKKLQYCLDKLGDDGKFYKAIIEWLLSLPSKK